MNETIDLKISGASTMPGGVEKIRSISGNTSGSAACNTPRAPIS